MGKKIIITGCGRSGTLYMQHVMAVLGFEIGHEGFLEDGISSWYIVDRMRAEQINKEFKKPEAVFFHLVRNPLKVMSSFRKCEYLPKRAGLDFFRRSMPQYNHLTEIAFLAKYWIHWNLQAEEVFDFDYRFRVEDVKSVFAVGEFCRLLNVEITQGICWRVKRISTNMHTVSESNINDLKNVNQLFPDITLEQVFRENEHIAEKLVNLADKYGYDLNEEVTA